MNETKNATSPVYLNELNIMNETYPYILTAIVFMIFVFIIFIIVKAFFKIIFNICILDRNKKFYQMYNTRSDISIHRRRDLYKCLWVTSFIINVGSMVFFIIYYFKYFNCELYIALYAIASLTIILSILCQYYLVPYIMGFTYILFNKLEYGVSYHLWTGNKKIFDNIKFEGVTVFDLKWVDNKTNRKFRMGTEQLRGYIIEKIGV
jgi:hypothetical protein